MVEKFFLRELSFRLKILNIFYMQFLSSLSKFLPMIVQIVSKL